MLRTPGAYIFSVRVQNSQSHLAQRRQAASARHATDSARARSGGARGTCLDCGHPMRRLSLRPSVCRNPAFSAVSYFSSDFLPPSQFAELCTQLMSRASSLPCPLFFSFPCIFCVGTSLTGRRRRTGGLTFPFGARGQNLVNYPPTTFLHMIVCELAWRREEE